MLKKGLFHSVHCPLESQQKTVSGQYAKREKAKQQ